MPSNAFTGGIDHGGLTNDFEVKILLCCLVNHLKEPVTQSELKKILIETGLVNYFELSDALSELLTTRHLTTDEEFALILSSLGKETVAEFEKSIPLSVREKCYQQAERFLTCRRRKEEISIHFHPVSDGWQLTCVMKDYGTDLINYTVFLPTEQECRHLESRMYAQPAHVYKGLLAVLTGSRSELAEYMQEEQEGHSPSSKRS